MNVLLDTRPHLLLGGATSSVRGLQCRPCLELGNENVEIITGIRKGHLSRSFGKSKFFESATHRELPIVSFSAPLYDMQHPHPRLQMAVPAPWHSVLMCLISRARLVPYSYTLTHSYSLLSPTYLPCYRVMYSFGRGFDC